MTPPNPDPLLADAVAWRQLSGLSGAQIYLMTLDNRHWFVRKAASRPEGSPRLRRQLQKQQAWRRLGGEIIRTPKVLNEGELDGRFYFDMEVVRGMDGVTYLRSADYAGVERFSNKLCRFAEAAAELPPLQPSPSAHDLFGALYSRVCDVHRTTSLLSPEDLSAILLGLEHVRNLGDLPPTWCHGDLTLENLIVDSEGEFWALDLLDAPFEHYWFDIAKLHQDLEGGWYLRHGAPIARCVTDFVGRRLFATAVKLDPRYELLHAVLLTVTFVRILPYVREPQALEFVQRRIAHFTNTLR